MSNELQDDLVKIMLDDEPESQTENTNNEPSPPAYGSEQWSHYVLSQLFPDEQEGGHPTCDGLRRLTEKLVGPITSRTITHLEPPKSPTGIATVGVCVTVLSNKLRSHIYEESVADVGPHNTEMPYAAHQSATAETRAEARALRKLLRLRKVISAEEVANINAEKIELSAWKAEDLITEEQLTLLDILCQKNNMDVLEFVNCGKNKYSHIKLIPQSVAGEMMQFLNGIQQQKIARPLNVTNYKTDWQNEVIK